MRGLTSHFFRGLLYPSILTRLTVLFDWQHGATWHFLSPSVPDLFPEPRLAGKGRKVEEPRRPHGRANDQRRAGDAPSRRLHRGVQARRVAGDLRLRGRVHAARDPLSADPRKTGQEKSWNLTKLVKFRTLPLEFSLIGHLQS